ncbi:hypothetical protein DRJ19_05350 [Candidatus Woesearchaeota archaeon]|nr:MAG: hypothetical protein DRJ19_05350 [Candidatus Woesearchaeota archaeon]
MVKLEGYVDTGATYSIVPGEILDSAGVRRTRRLAVKGICCMKTVDVGDALFRVEVDDEVVEGVSSVVFGDDPNLILLGSHTLGALGLEADPVNKKLKKASYIAMY